MEHVSWGPAVGVLLVGLAFGAVLAWRLRTARPPQDAEDAAAALRELEARRDTLLDQMRELEDTALGHDQADVARRRDELETKAARVLAELDQQKATVRPARPAAGAPAPVAAPAVPAHNAARRGFAWGVLSALAVGGLVLWVSGIAHPREEGGSLTGAPGLPGATPRPGPMRRPGGQAAADPEVQRLQEIVNRAPDDIEARLALTQAYLARSQFMQAWEETRAILARSPGNPRALSYQALVRLAMGQAGEAEKMLKQAMASAPNLLEPRLHLSLVYARTGRMAEADAVLDEAKRLFPRDAEGLGQLQREMKAQASGEGAPEDQPAAAEGGAGAGPAAGEAQVSGEIDLDPSRGAAPPGAIVFVTARAVGQTSGPPLAVKRLPASFPLQFTLGSGDSMMGQELPGQLRLEARLDSDGDPLTRTPQDPTARIDDVRLGQGGLHLRLQ